MHMSSMCSEFLLDLTLLIDGRGDCEVLKVRGSTLMLLLVSEAHCELSECSRGQSVINPLSPVTRP